MCVSITMVSLEMDLCTEGQGHNVTLNLLNADIFKIIHARIII